MIRRVRPCPPTKEVCQRPAYTNLPYREGDQCDGDLWRPDRTLMPTPADIGLPDDAWDQVAPQPCGPDPRYIPIPMGEIPEGNEQNERCPISYGYPATPESFDKLNIRILNDPDNGAVVQLAIFTVPARHHGTFNRWGIKITPAPPAGTDFTLTVEIQSEVGGVPSTANGFFRDYDQMLPALIPCLGNTEENLLIHTLIDIHQNDTVRILANVGDMNAVPITVTTRLKGVIYNMPCVPNEESKIFAVATAL